jgi:riboflavin synthase
MFTGIVEECGEVESFSRAGGAWRLKVAARSVTDGVAGESVAVNGCCLTADSRLGGHFVTGHIDGRGTIEVFESRGADHYLRIRGPQGCGRLLVMKGSVAVDGISLTVAEVEGDSFAVWIIPHTLAVTNLRIRGAGDTVNLEFDMLGKYVEKLLQTQKIPTARECASP